MSEQETVGERLREAIAYQGWSKKQFQREMVKLDVPGVSYPSIIGYLSDRAVPTLPFLREAAHLLGVREPWLICGQGERTEEDEAQPKLRLKLTKDLDQVFQEGFPAFSRLYPVGRSAAWNAWRGQLLAVEQRTGRVTEERKKHWLPVGRRVARAFQAPIQALKLDPKKLTSGQLHRYVNLMQHAMLALCPDEIVERTFFQPDVPRPGQADAVAADAPEPEELQAP